MRAILPEPVVLFYMQESGFIPPARLLSQANPSLQKAIFAKAFIYLKNYITMKRRKFIAASASAGVSLGLFSIIPSHVFAAAKKGLTPPSDRITMVHIAAGSESLNEIGPLLRAPGIEIVGIADPNTESYDYIHWSPNGLRDSLRKIMDEPNWKADKRGIPGGRNVMKEVVETYYRKNRQARNGTIRVAEDYRELLEQIKDVDAVKIMSPDHLHAW